MLGQARAAGLDATIDGWLDQHPAGSVRRRRAARRSARPDRGSRDHARASTDADVTRLEQLDRRGRSRAAAAASLHRPGRRARRRRAAPGAHRLPPRRAPHRRARRRRRRRRSSSSTSTGCRTCCSSSPGSPTPVPAWPTGSGSDPRRVVRVLRADRADALRELSRSPRACCRRACALTWRPSTPSRGSPTTSPTRGTRRSRCGTPGSTSGSRDCMAPHRAHSAHSGPSTLTPEMAAQAPPIFEALANTVRVCELPTSLLEDLRERVQAGRHRDAIRLVGGTVRLLPAIGEPGRTARAAHRWLA